MKIMYFLFFSMVSILVIKSNNNCCNNCLKSNKNIKDLNKNKGNKVKGNNEYIKYKKNNKDYKNNDGDKKDNENKTNKQNDKYYLDSGYDIDLPLNIEWRKCNCSVLSIFRFFISDKYFLDKLINKKTSIFNEDQKKRKIDKMNRIQNNDNVINNISELFKKILKTKGEYNKEIEGILDVIKVNSTSDAFTILLKFISFYFFEKFYFTEKNKYLNIYEYRQFEFINQFQNIYDTNDYYLLQNDERNKIKINEVIKKIQFNNSIKKYELIGIIGVCGIVDTPSLEYSDCVSILPVFDKNKGKKGYVIYQFNGKSEIMSVDELNKLDKFGNWKNPRFHLLIYREIKS